MKVKLKVKQLVIGLLLVGVLIFLTNTVIFPELMLRKANQEIAAGQEQGKGRMLQLLDNYKLGYKRLDIIRDYMIEAYDVYAPHNTMEIYVSPAFSSWSHGDRPVRFAIEERLPYLLEYVERAPVNGYLFRAVDQIVRHYLDEKLYTLAETLLLEVEARKRGTTWKNDHRLSLLLVELYIEQGRLDDAEQKLQEIQEQERENFARLKAADPNYPGGYYQSEKWSQLQVEISLRRGELMLALEQVDEGIRHLRAYDDYFNQLREQWGEEQHLTAIRDYSPLDLLKEKILHQLDMEATSRGSISGHISRFTGEPLSGVQVFLRDRSNVNRTPIYRDIYTVTDQNGYYSFQDVLPGAYQLGLGLSLDYVDGWMWQHDRYQWLKVEQQETIEHNLTFMPLIDLKGPTNYDVVAEEQLRFEWEEVEGAAYYGLNLGHLREDGHTLVPLFSNITQPYLEIPVSELYGQEFGVVFEPPIDPITVLSFTNPEHTFIWSVSAYTADGKLLTQSNGYRLREDLAHNLPFFKLHERELSLADQLLLEGDVEQAKRAYLLAYRNSQDIHALRMLTRIIEKDTPEYEAYLTELASFGQSSNELKKVLNFYKERNDWQSYHNWYEHYHQYLQIHGIAPDDYTEITHAVALLQQGFYQEARSLFETYIPRNQYNYYASLWLALEIYLDSPDDLVLQIAENYPDRSGLTQVDWARTTRDLQQAVKEDKRAQQELKAALEVILGGEREGDIRSNNVYVRAFIHAVKDAAFR